MSNYKQAVVKQKPTEKHPDAEVTFNDMGYEFASVFKKLFPDVDCPHCFARFRLLFIAGIASADQFYDGLNKIGEKKAMHEAAVWWQSQVEEGKQELEVELRIAQAESDGCYHDEESSGYH
jgi:hypothetical protein